MREPSTIYPSCRLGGGARLAFGSGIPLAARNCFAAASKVSYSSMASIQRSLFGVMRLRKSGLMPNKGSQPKPRLHSWTQRVIFLQALYGWMSILPWFPSALLCHRGDQCTTDAIGNIIVPTRSMVD